ncbi:MAG: hypothetical protein ACQ9MH_09180 [Nitrospinales bacterium]
MTDIEAKDPWACGNTAIEVTIDKKTNAIKLKICCFSNFDFIHSYELIAGR